MATEGIHVSLALLKRHVRYLGPENVAIKLATPAQCREVE